MNMNTAPRKTPNKLQIVEGYKLCDWLTRHKFMPNETYPSLAAAAGADLGIPKISAAHVSERMRALNLSIPASVVTSYSAEYVEQLRGDIQVLAKLVMQLVLHSTAGFARDLTERANDLAGN
jgi:hypothetical protein